MKTYLLFWNSVFWITLTYLSCQKNTAKINLNTFYLLFIDILKGAVLRTLHNPKSTRESRKRAVETSCRARKEVAKVSTPRENPRGD